MLAGEDHVTVELRAAAEWREEAATGPITAAHCMAQQPLIEESL